MSQYAFFFVRHNDEFLPIANYSRSNYLYQVYNEFLPYEKIKPLTKENLSTILGMMENDIQLSKDNLISLDKRKNFVRNCNNSLDEKMIELDKIDESIDEVKEDLDIQTYAAHFTNFLMEMCGSAYDTKYNPEDGIKLDSDTYIYGGIEISDPTMEDLAE